MLKKNFNFAGRLMEHAEEAVCVRRIPIAPVCQDQREKVRVSVD
jgi:hypothetical protein